MSTEGQDLRVLDPTCVKTRQRECVKERREIVKIGPKVVGNRESRPNKCWEIVKIAFQKASKSCSRNSSVTDSIRLSQAHEVHQLL